MTVGTSRGLIEQFHSNPTNTSRITSIFLNLWTFFYGMCGSSLPCELIAIQFGSGGTADPGLDPIASPTFGQDAFFVIRYKKTGETGTSTARTHSIYVLFQLGQNSMGGSPGAPAVSDIGGGICGIALQTAVGVNNLGADSNPWTGTTNKDGSDTKGATPQTGPVWDVSGGSVFVSPRANNTGGTYATNKQYLLALATSYTGNPPPLWSRVNFMSDDDCFHIAVCYNADENYEVITTGLVTPRSGITLPASSHIVFHNNPTNYDTVRAEGMLAKSGGNWQMLNYVNVFPYGISQPFQPNVHADTPDYEDFPLVLFCQEVPGYMGVANTMRYCTNRTQLSLSTDKLTIHIGNNQTLNDVRWLLPWNGTTDPGTGITSAGVAFAI